MDFLTIPDSVFGKQPAYRLCCSNAGGHFHTSRVLLTRDDFLGDKNKDLD